MVEDEFYSMAKVEIDRYGIKRYFNEARQLHREDGPAYINPEGAKYHYVNGKQHSTDRPSDTFPNGTRRWYIDHKEQSIDRPSNDSPNGHKEWYSDDESTWPKL